MGKNNPPISQWDWDDLSGMKDIKDSGLDLIRQYLLYIKATPMLRPLSLFFTSVLRSYFDDTESRLSREACSAVYRLSEQLEPGVRAFIDVWPTADGAPWVTLENWRQMFIDTLKNGENDIHIFYGQLPELPRF